MNDPSIPVSSPTHSAPQQKRLSESEERYRGIFEHLTVAIWEEDFSDVKSELDRLRAEGMVDFRSFIKEHPEFLYQAVRLANIIDANEAMVRQGNRI